MTDNLDSDITNWEYNIYKCDNCNVRWKEAFPVHGSTTIIIEEKLCCFKCGCLGRLLQSKKVPTLIGKIKNAT